MYLPYNAANRHNCVVTTKATSVGALSATSAFLEVKGSSRRTDSGKFSYFAGP